jgi:predicted transcriptional regulator with HTH domain
VTRLGYLDRTAAGGPVQPLVEPPAPRRPSGAIVRFAIARSRARRSVLLFLAERRSSYPSEIARSTAFTVTNVLGALVGSRERYQDGLSLVQLGLVAEETSGGDPIRSFAITDVGLALARELHRPLALQPM